MAGMLQALLETTNPRVVLPGRNGPPKAPLALRVSAMRQGVTGTKLSAAVKVADTVCAEFMVTTHAAVPEHAPPHPPNLESAAGVAVIVTMVPGLRLAEQVLPQLMDASLLLTVPLPVPCLLTCNVKAVIVKLAALVAVPSSVVTVMAPVVAAVGTVVVIVPELLTVNAAGAPLNATDVAPVKVEPVIVTPVPAAPKVGAKEVMAGVTVKRVVVVKGLLLGVVTVMGPVVAPAGTVVVIVPELVTVKLAGTPLNETAVAPMKVAPEIVTLVPAGPKVGVNGLKLIPSRKATMSSAAVGPIAVRLIPPTNEAPGELLKKDEL